MHGRQREGVACRRGAEAVAWPGVADDPCWDGLVCGATRGWAPWWVAALSVLPLRAELGQQHCLAALALAVDEPPVLVRLPLDADLERQAAIAADLPRAQPLLGLELELVAH